MAQSKQWKEAEREVARLLNSVRIGPSGSNTPDIGVRSPQESLGAEVKYMQRLSLRSEHLDQAQRNALDHGYLDWALFIREAKSGRRVVVISYDYFAKLFHNQKEDQ